MITDKYLSDLFAEQAENRPDARQVLAAVHDQLDRRPTVIITRSATALGAVAAVAAIAVGSSVISHHSSGHPINVVAGNSTSASDPAPSAAPTMTTPPPPSSVPASATPTPTTPAPSPTASGGGPVVLKPSPSYDYSTIAAGWLPGAVTAQTAQNSAGFEERDYTVSVDGVDMDVIIWVETGPLPTSMQATGGGNYTNMTVQGHAAREFVSSNITIVAVDLGNGNVAYAGPSVQTTTATVTSARIKSIAEQVANGIEYGRHDPIPAN
jgi:hypothetical protein